MSGEILCIGGKSAESSATTLMGIITGSEGLLSVIAESRCASCRSRRLHARPDGRGFARVEAAGESWRGSSAPASFRWHGDDGQACDPAPPKPSSVRLSARRRGAADDRLDGPGVEVDELIAAWSNGARFRSTTCQISMPRPSATCSGAGRKAACGGTDFADYLCMDGTVPRGNCRRPWRRSQYLRQNTICASPTCFAPATAICIP